MRFVSVAVREVSTTGELHIHSETDLSLEGMTGIEPAPSVWKTEALPLSYIPTAIGLGPSRGSSLIQKLNAVIARR